MLQGRLSQDVCLGVEVGEDGEHSLDAGLVRGEAGLTIDQGDLAFLLEVVEVYESSE